MSLPEGIPWPSASELPELSNPHGAKIQDLGQEFLARFSPGAPKWQVFWGKSSRNGENHRKYIATYSQITYFYDCFVMGTSAQISYKWKFQRENPRTKSAIDWKIHGTNGQSSSHVWLPEGKFRFGGWQSLFLFTTCCYMFISCFLFFCIWYNVYIYIYSMYIYIYIHIYIYIYMILWQSLKGKNPSG